MIPQRLFNVGCLLIMKADFIREVFMNFRLLHVFCDFMVNIILHAKVILAFCLGCLIANPLWSDELSRTIENIKPSVVGIGTFQKTRSPPVSFIGTGFVVGDGPG